MSFAKKLFGGKKEEKAPTTGEALQRLRDTEEMLIKKQEYLEKKISMEMITIKTNGTKNKRVAIQALKRKKWYERQLQQISGTLGTIEMQRDVLENADTNTAVLGSMKSAADAIKQAHKHVDVDKILDIVDDIGEQAETGREIADAISHPVAFKEDVDEDELERELRELEQEMLDEVGPSTDELPAVPQSEIVKPKPSKKTAIEDLAGWAS